MFCLLTDKYSAFFLILNFSFNCHISHQWIATTNGNYKVFIIKEIKLNGIYNFSHCTRTQKLSDLL